MTSDRTPSDSPHSEAGSSDDTLVRLAWALVPLVFVVGGSAFLAVYLSGAVRTGGSAAVPIAFGIVAIVVGIAGIVAMVGGVGRKR